MPLVPGICPQCGGKISVDDSQKAAVCGFCGTPFIVQEAIENHNHYTVNQFGEGAIVNITEGDSREKLYANGETALRIRNFALAQETFTKYAKNYPQDYEAWWGLCRAQTNDLTNYNAPLDAPQENYSYARQLCKNGQKLTEMESKFSAYLLKCADVYTGGFTNMNLPVDTVASYFRRIKAVNTDGEALAADESRLWNYLYGYAEHRVPSLRSSVNSRLEAEKNIALQKSASLAAEQKSLKLHERHKTTKFVLLGMTALAALLIAIGVLWTIAAFSSTNEPSGVAAAVAAIGIVLMIISRKCDKYAKFSVLNSRINDCNTAIGGSRNFIETKNGNIARLARVASMTDDTLGKYGFNRVCERNALDKSIPFGEYDFIKNVLDENNADGWML